MACDSVPPAEGDSAPDGSPGAPGDFVSGAAGTAGVVVVSDGRADTLLAALEREDNAGATVAVSGHYSLARGATVARGITLVGLDDDQGIPPTITVASLDEQQEGDCLGVLCLSGGHSVENVALSVVIDPELARAGFPVVNASDKWDGELKLVDVDQSGGVAASIQVTVAVDASQLEVVAERGAISVVQSPAAVGSTSGVSFRHFASGAAVQARLSQVSIRGVDTGIAVRTEGVDGGELDVKWIDSNITATEAAVEAQSFDTELLMMDLSGDGGSVQGGTSLASLQPFGGVAATGNVVTLKLSGVELVGADRAAVATVHPPEPGHVAVDNIVQVKVESPDASSPLDFAVPYVAGNRTSVVIDD